MKVGTDGVLLGAWAPIHHHPQTVLDIGAGTGLIALMIAQRSGAQQIDALEIDEAAYEECVENFEQSPWGDRLFCFHAGLDEFIDEPEDEYDLIVSNPPFYSAEFSSGNEARDRARFASAMPLEQLAEAAGLLLSDRGKFAVILPFEEEEKFIGLASYHDLFLEKATRVRGNVSSAIKRSLMAFSRSASKPEIEELAIEVARHQYTSEYTALTRDFYLRM